MGYKVVISGNIGPYSSGYFDWRFVGKESTYAQDVELACMIRFSAGVLGHESFIYYLIDCRCVPYDIVEGSVPFDEQQEMLQLALISVAQGLKQCVKRVTLEDKVFYSALLGASPAAILPFIICTFGVCSRTV